MIRSFVCRARTGFAKKWAERAIGILFLIGFANAQLLDATEVTVAHDQLSRIIRNQFGSTAVELFTYDSAGNRTTSSSSIDFALEPIASQITTAGAPSLELPVNIVSTKAPEVLGLLARSSKTSLVAQDGFQFEGAGAFRTLMITPKPGRIGVTEITIIASDGQVGTSTSFLLSVRPGPSILSINNCNAVKEDAQLTYGYFDVFLSSPQAEDVSVNFATIDVDAQAGLEYEAVSGKLTFMPGETVKQIKVPVHSNTDWESDKRFKCILSDPQNATLRKSIGTCAIRSSGFPMQFIRTDLALQFDRTYGDPPLKLYAKANSGLPVKFRVSGTSQGAYDDSNQTLRFLEAGVISVEAYQEGDSDWLPIARQWSIYVLKANLFESTDDKVIVQGDPFPEFTFSYDGFILGDTQNVLNTLPSIYMKATSTIIPGAYPIKFLEPGIDNNYQMIRRKEGTLTILPALVTFSDMHLIDSALNCTLQGPDGLTFDIQVSEDFLKWRHLFGVSIGPSKSVDIKIPIEHGESRFFRAHQSFKPEPSTDYAKVSSGTFIMGSPLGQQDRGLDEGPETEVTISEPFWISIAEVTQRDFQKIMYFNPSGVKDLDLPVHSVKWADAVEYCTRLTENERQASRISKDYEYRLPTEAEWEFAYRGSTTTRFPFGDDLSNTEILNYAWLQLNSEDHLHVGKSKMPGLNGLSDMGGSVWEWCSDWYDDHLSGASLLDPTGPAAGTYRVMKGGCWTCGPDGARSGARNYGDDFERFAQSGFRPVLSAVKTFKSP